MKKIRFLLAPLCLSGLVILFSGCTIVGAVVGAKCDRNHARGCSRRMAEAQSCDSAIFHSPVEVAYKEYETDYNAARAKLDSVSLPSLGETVVVSNKAGLSQRAVFSGLRADSVLFGVNPVRLTALAHIYQMTDTSGRPYALRGVESLVRNRMIPERDPLLDRALGMHGTRQALAMDKPARKTRYRLVGMGIGLLVDGIIIAAIAKDPDGFVARLIPPGPLD